MRLQVCQWQWDQGVRETGILVRAENPFDGGVGTWDIAYLTEDSLVNWLESRGPVDPWVRSLVLTLVPRAEELMTKQEIEELRAWLASPDAMDYAILSPAHAVYVMKLERDLKRAEGQ